MISKKIKIGAILVIVVLFLLVFLQGEKKIEVEVENSFLVIKNAEIKKDGKKYDYQLLRLEGENDPVYAMYYPNKGAKETVLITDPYDKIDWTGEKIDAHHWKSHSVADATESANLSLMNGFGVLLVYARFYEGGDINNDIEDIVAGLKFLENRTEKIGIYGGSWGGFESLYGAINSPVKPVVGVALYPPSDMGSWLEWTYKTSENEFWEPYRKRVKEGAKNDFSNWSHDYVSENLTTNFLIMHAHEDSLVPFDQSSRLAEKSDKIDEMWLRKKGGRLSHGESLHDEKIPMEVMVSFTYLMRGLTGRELLMFLDKKGMENYLSDLAIFKGEGKDISWSKTLFEKMFLPNINYHDVETGKIVTSEELKKEFQEKIEKLGVSL